MYTYALYRTNIPVDSEKVTDVEIGVTGKGILFLKINGKIVASGPVHPDYIKHNMVRVVGGHAGAYFNADKPENSVPDGAWLVNGPLEFVQSGNRK